jgi:hypothetical protein
VVIEAEKVASHVFNYRNSAAIYWPPMECDSLLDENDCYLLTPGLITSAMFFQPTYSETYESNFRLSKSMKGWAECLVNDVVTESKSFLTQGAISLSIGSLFAALALL